MTDHGWGPAPSGADMNGTAPAQDTGAFGTSELQEALPINGNKQAETKPETPPGWVLPTAYDYTAYGKGDNNEWDSNAHVYEWDGENGDIGPEHPALEAQLFGDPDKRGKQGIDFSK